MLLYPMKILSFSGLLSLALSQTSIESAATSSTSTSTAPITEYTIAADNITAKFIPYGARLTSLLVPDRDGVQQDVVPGYDDPAEYLTDTATNHTYFGAVVGRYANRIKNSTFTINGQTYNIPANEHDGADTLHGGNIGYDQRNWTVLTHNDTSVSFSLLDTAFEGFPGTVLTTATYSVSAYASGPQGQLRPRLTTSLISIALDHDTPIMLANHIYWNLNGFKAPTILNDTTLWMPYSKRFIEIDPILIPTGAIGTVSSAAALDFTSPKLFGTAVSNATGVCGAECTGIDNAFIIDRPLDAGPTSSSFPVLSMWSKTTGIQLDVSTNQQGVQIYTCNGQNGTIPVKSSQQQRNNGSADAVDVVNKYGCVAVEPQAWIDGINHPEWGVDKYEIFGPSTGPAVNYATYDFSTF